MNRRPLYALAFLGLLAVPAVAFAAGPGFGGGCHRPKVTSAEELADHMSRGADRALDRVDATDAQRDRVEAVIDEMAPKLFALKADHEPLRDQVSAALTGETVDRAALESARAAGLDVAEDASRILVEGLADAAEALDAEQRQELADLWARFHD